MLRSEDKTSVCRRELRKYPLFNDIARIIVHRGTGFLLNSLTLLLYHFTMQLLNRLSYAFSLSSNDLIVFFGSGKMALPSLKILHKKYTNLTVITHGNQSNGKSFNGVETYCIQNQLEYKTPVTNRSSKQKRAEEWKTYIESMVRPKFGVVCSYGYMLPSKLISQFDDGLIVVHPSLLPKYRGGAPIFHAIANGDSVSGVSYIQISKGAFDHGNILHQVQCQIGEMQEYDKIQLLLSEEAGKHLPFVLDHLDTLRPGKSQNQLKDTIPKQLLTAPIIKSKHLNLNMPAESVFNWSRALMSSKVKFMATNKDIILKFSREYSEGDGEIGTFKVIGKRLYVRCADCYLRVTGFYDPSKKQSPAGIFIAEYIKSGKYPQQSIKVQ